MKKNVFLAVTLLAFIAVGAFAQQYDSESDFQVTKTATEVTITKYVGKKTAVNIPPRIQNLPVTTIGKNAFSRIATITSVTIPEGVKKIDFEAFALCTGLTSVTIPKSVISIGKIAFAECKNLTSVTFEGGINKNNFGEGSPVPGDLPFPGDLNQKYYDGSPAIGWQATYTRPNGTSTTWTRQSKTNTATQSVSESDFQVTKAGNAITITGYTGSATVVNIPATIQNTPVTEIGEKAFWEKTNITSITIPNSVKSIGEGAFFRCEKLTSIIIPNSVTSIGGSAFSRCISLTSVTIGSGITNIPNSAFMSCQKLASVTIPKTVTKINNFAFSGCDSLTSVTFQGTYTSANFGSNKSFDGDLRDKFYATDKTNGTPGTYTLSGNTWTKK